MKVAICFAGLPYYIKQNKRYWQEVIEKYDADVYASLWDEENVYQEGDTIQAFKEAYKPLKLEVESQKAFTNSFASINQEYLSSPEYFNKSMDFAHKSGRIYSMLYKIWRANILASSKGRSYDVIVRAETCSSYPDLEIVAEDGLSLPYWHHVYNLGNYNTVNLNNWVAFGPPYVMDYYCSAFLKLRKYYDECLIHPVESIINYHLAQRPNLNIRLFFSKIFRKGVLNWNGGKYNTKRTINTAWYTSIENILSGYDDACLADEEFDGSNTHDTSLKNKQGLDCHSMAKEPINITKPESEKGKKEEGSYHDIHKFSPKKKAFDEFNDPYEDEDGNWTTKENWMHDNSEEKLAAALLKRDTIEK